MGTVVVTGVAGSLGRRLAELLAAAARADDRIVGIDVVPVSGLPAAVELRVLDLASAPVMARSAGSAPGEGEDPVGQYFEGADGVIHLAWHTPDRHRHPVEERQAIAQGNQRALRRVLDAAAAGHVSRLVHLSSATVYGAWADNKVPLTEEAPLRPNPEFDFAVSKAEAERLVVEWSEDHPQVRVSVLRPAVTVGSPERPLYQALGGTRTLGAHDGSRPVQYLHVDDLAAAVMAVYQASASGVFNVAPDNGIPEDVARELVGGVARMTLPGRVARAVAGWTWHLWRSGVPKEAQAYAIHPWVVAADRLRGLGWVPLYSSEEALVATDARAHWDDLPPGTRQNYTLLLALAGVAAVGGGIGATVVALRRRQRR